LGEHKIHKSEEIKRYSRRNQTFVL